MPLPKTETLAAPNQPSTSHRTRTIGGTPKPRWRSLSTLGHTLVGSWAVLAALATGLQLNWVQVLERQAQTFGFELRGPIAPPDNVVILAMDESSYVQGTQAYPADPKKYAYFEPLQTSIPKRSAYAIAIERLMQAGAKAVAIDVVMDAPSAHGLEDDEQVMRALANYSGRVTLAAQYDTSAMDQGQQAQLIMPNSLFQTLNPSIGFINYPIAPDGKIYELGHQFLHHLAQSYPPELTDTILSQNTQVPSFAEATLQAAKLPYPAPTGQQISFYGPPGTFPQISFWKVLDPIEWSNARQAGTFKDKIVLIGPTAKTYQDFHAVPFAESWRYGTDKMTGIEVNANALATLLQNRSIAIALPDPALQGVFVFVLVAGAGFLQSRVKRSLFRFLVACGVVVGVGMIGYVSFVYGRLIFPIAVPIVAIGISGMSYFMTASASEYREKVRLRQILKENPHSDIARRIISEQYDLQDLLEERQRELFGTKLRGRYKIIKVLGSGGFGETYVAEDTDLPGNPACVVKWLKPASKNFKLLKLAKRLFDREAQTLASLGRHDQIPQLLAYFEEEEEFYLVQQFVEGQPLNMRLRLGKMLPESEVIFLLQELLKILEFVHSQGVIHRDIKPSNIIQRASDGKPVLIDFGAVKEIHQLSEDTEQTVGIGTKGYMPIEQSCGEPRPCSDIYAVGMIGIQALTGLPPSELPKDTHAREILWRAKAQQVSHTLADVLSTMVRFHYRDRYQSATEALQALNQVAIASTTTTALVDAASIPQAEAALPVTDASDTSAAAPTKIWECDSMPHTLTDDTVQSDTPTE